MKKLSDNETIWKALLTETEEEYIEVYKEIFEDDHHIEEKNNEQEKAKPIKVIN